jgi:hypothetical protein
VSARQRAATGKPGVRQWDAVKGGRTFEVWLPRRRRQKALQTATVAALARSGMQPSGRNGRVLLSDAVGLREKLNTAVRAGDVAPMKATVREVGDAWLEAQTGLRDRTKASYRWALDVHVYPTLGRRRVQDPSTDDVAACWRA